MRKQIPIRTLGCMTRTLIGYARCSTDKQDLEAQKQALAALGVAEDRIYTDHGMTGTNRARAPASTRLSPPCARATRSWSPSSTAWRGRFPMPAPSPTSSPPRA